MGIIITSYSQSSGVNIAYMHQAMPQGSVCVPQASLQLSEETDTIITSILQMRKQRLGRSDSSGVTRLMS